MSIRSILTAAALALGVVLMPTHSLAIINGTPPPCEDRRFDSVGLFMNAGFWSCAGWISGTCILVAPDRVLVARHSLDLGANQQLPDAQTSAYRVRFRRSLSGDAANSFYVNGNNCHGISQEIRVARFVDAPQTGTDMVMAYLERPVVGIRPMGMELNSTPPAGSRIVLAGWGYDGACFQNGDTGTLRSAVGQLPFPISGAFFTYTPCSIASTAPCLTCPAGGPWASANLHDSGGAVMIEVPGPSGTPPELRLLGTISTLGQARRVTLWNQAGGQPQLLQAQNLTDRDLADFNRDGAETSEDLMSYLTAFFSGKCIADLSNNGSVAVDDLFSYLNTFFAGQ